MPAFLATGDVRGKERAIGEGCIVKRPVRADGAHIRKVQCRQSSRGEHDVEKSNGEYIHLALATIKV